MELDLNQQGNLQRDPLGSKACMCIEPGIRNQRVDHRRVLGHTNGLNAHVAYKNQFKHVNTQKQTSTWQVSEMYLKCTVLRYTDSATRTGLTGRGNFYSVSWAKGTKWSGRLQHTTLIVYCSIMVCKALRPHFTLFMAYGFFCVRLNI